MEPKCSQRFLIAGLGAGAFAACILAGCTSSVIDRSPITELRDRGLVSSDDLHDPKPTESQWKERDGFVIPDTGPVSLEMLFALAERDNPRIAAGRAAIGVAGGRAWQVGLYPNPSVEFESENIRPSNGGLRRAETTIGIAQPIVISERRRAAVDAGSAEMDVRIWELADLQRKVHGAIRREVVEIVFILKSIELRESVLELADRTVEIAETRFEARAAAESEAIRARVERNSQLLEIDRLHGELSATGERLQALLGGQPIDPHRIDFQPQAERFIFESVWGDGDLESLEAIVEASHPALQALRAAVRGAERVVELEREKATPDLIGRIGVGVDHDSDEAFIEAGIGIPILMSDRNQGAILAARFEVMQREREVEALLDDLRAHLGESFHRWRSASTRLASFNENILQDAQRAFEQTDAGYAAGHHSFLELLDAQRTLIEAKVTQLALHHDAQMALADIRAIVGARRDDPH